MYGYRDMMVVGYRDMMSVGYRDMMSVGIQRYDECRDTELEG